jgi:4-amino-4-deoxy-L-arabinose transferase-like glycosyltransferase
MSTLTAPAERQGLSKNHRIAAGVFLYGFVAAAFFAFVFYARTGAVAPDVDVNGFGQMARYIAQGDGFTLGYGPTIRRAPLYPYFGGALLWLSGNDLHAFPDAVFYRPLLLANCVMFAITSVLVWSMTRRAFGERAALLAVAICPLIPQSLRYVARTEVEMFTELSVALLAYTGIELAARPGPKSAAVFGLVAAASTLSKPVTQLYPFVFAPLVYWYWHKQHVPTRARVVALSVTLACFALPLVPWSLRNATVTNGAFRGISSNAAAEFLRGYVNAQSKYFLLRQDFGGSDPLPLKWDPEANEYEERMLAPHGLPFYRTSYDENGRLFLTPDVPKGVTSASIELQKDAIQSAEVKRRVLANPLEFLGKFTVQLGTFWYMAETRVKSLFIGSIAVVMLGLAALGVFDARRRGALVWPVALVILYHNALYAAFLALGRYSMPMFPTLLVLSAGGAAVLFKRFWPFRGVGSAGPAEAPGGST